MRSGFLWMGKEKWFLELESIPEDAGEMTTKY